MKTRLRSTSRLEPDTRCTDPRPGARIPLADPAWMLGRQWWVGELQGSDHALPARAEIEVAVEPLTSTDRPGSGPNVPLPLDPDRRPVDAALGEPAILGGPGEARRALARGRQLVRMLEQAGAEAREAGDRGGERGVRKALTQLRADFPLEATSPAARRAAQHGALVDGVAVEARVRGMAAADRAALAASWRSAGAWLDEIDLGRPAIEGHETPGATGTFDRADLDHDLRLEGAHGTRFEVTDAPGPQLRWADADVARVRTPPAWETHTSMPSRSVVEGAPPDRWWTRQPGGTDWVSAPAGPADLARLVVAAAFAEQEVGWFLVRVPAQTDAAVHVREVRLIDGFGRVATHAAASDPTMKLWVDGAQPLLCLAEAPTVGGPAVERTEIRADDALNMVWAVERRVPEPWSGRGHEIDDTPFAFAVTEPTAVMRTPVPEGWIPYLRDTDPDVALMHRRPLSELDGAGAVRGLVATETLPLRRDEVPVAGATVLRTPRLGRSRDGRRTTWVVRTRGGPGTGGGSGLRHDAVVKPEA